MLRLRRWRLAKDSQGMIMRTSPTDAICRIRANTAIRGYGVLGGTPSIAVGGSWSVSRGTTRAASFRALARAALRAAALLALGDLFATFFCGFFIGVGLSGSG